MKYETTTVKDLSFSLRLFLSSLVQILTSGFLFTQCNTGTIYTSPASTEVIFSMTLCKRHGDTQEAEANGKFF